MLFEKFPVHRELNLGLSFWRLKMVKIWLKVTDSNEIKSNWPGTMFVFQETVEFLIVMWCFSKILFNFQWARELADNSSQLHKDEVSRREAFLVNLGKLDDSIIFEKF